MAAAALARTYGDALDVPGAQRPALVQQASLHDAAVPNQLAVIEDQRVHPAEHILECVVGDDAKRPVEQSTDR